MKKILILVLFFSFSGYASDQHKEGLGKRTITVASLNVLHETFYQQHAVKGQAMDLQNRADLFKKLDFKADIVCLQEWLGLPSNSRGKFMQSLLNNPTMKRTFCAFDCFFNYKNICNGSVPVAVTFDNTCKTSDYTFIHTPLIIIDTHYFNIEKKELHILEAKKGQQSRDWDEENVRVNAQKEDTISKALLFALLRNGNFTLGVINGHVPFDGSGLHQKSIQLIKKIVAENSGVTFWSICGDFNWDTLVEENKESLKAAFGDGWVFSCDDGSITCTARSVQKDQKNQVLDHIISKGFGEENIEYDVLPENTSSLICHQGNAPLYDGKWLSDHALLRAKYSLGFTLSPILRLSESSNKNKKPSDLMWTQFLNHMSLNRKYYVASILVCIIGGYVMKNYSSKI